MTTLGGAADNLEAEWYASPRPSRVRLVDRATPDAMCVAVALALVQSALGSSDDH